ncbi:hypothetical protein, conserved [Angomonas deanei]|uniref:Uncharacterized protein n=1 Tax=Angomonas deanei TaxID=59799 RepID=A0A7G2CIA8_9TRYP|nr:hypothetical protein, conserved [Angomonas deanei]
MERIFNLLNSEEFKSSTAEQKRVIAGNLLERVCAAKARVLELSEGDNPIITELIVPLEELLERMTDSGHASEQFLEICETLSEIKDLIHSPDFVSATAEVKVGVVRQVLPQLKTISATFPTLSPKERKAVEQLIDPINSELQSILRGTTRTAPTQPKQSPQSTILRLQQVMGVLQSEEFATASPEERQELVEQCTADLRELKQEAKEGLGEMAGNVVPIIDRLLKQLEELSSHDSETLRGGEEKPDAVERRKFFESLEGITTVLKQRNDKQAGDFGGDVTAFVELSKLASTIDNLSEEEERIKSEFEKELAKLFSDAQGEEEEEEGKVNLADFKRFFATVLNHLTTTGVSTFEESAMVMSRVEGVLSEADRSGLEWRTDKESVTLVQNVLAEIQKSQQNLRSTDSRIKNLLDEATARINENPNMNSDELDSYYDFLQQVQAKQANFSLPELQAFKNFQEAILRASRQATNNSSRMNKEDITSTLLEISDRLRDSKMSPEELDQYDGIVAQLMNANLGEEFKEPLASIKEQIHLQRVSNDPEAYGGSDKPEDEEKSSDDDPVIENNESSEEAQSDTNELSGVRIDEDVDENGVNLVNLLPKIEEKVGLTNEAFTKSCSKFDVQMISKILVTISFSKMYHQDKALKARVDGLKTTFLEKLKAFEGSDSPSTDVMPSKKLRVTGEEVDSEDGLHAKEFTIYTESEADNFTENPELMRLMCNENLAETEVAEGVKENWVGKSCAFIISCNCTPQTDTSLAEITLLRDVLAKRYNFDVQIILDPKLNAENFEKIITRHVEEHKPNRLLLFYHSPKAHEGVAVPHSVLFHDSSVLSHKRILEVTKEVERLLIIQSLPRQLEISGRLREEFSPLMTVRLSSSASKEISSCRCWLFDDIFTPIVIELLSREEAKLLCPEDVMNYALTASTTLDFGFGSFMKREASSMGYFSPTSPNQ